MYNQGISLIPRTVIDLTHKILSGSNVVPMHDTLHISVSPRIPPPKELKTLSIIIPAYNEGKTITQILDKIRSVLLIHDIEKEIIIINDCSKDNTEQVIMEYISTYKETRIKYLAFPANSGKGAAIQAGILQATGEYLIIQDADLEYDPFEYNVLLKPIVHGFADVVYGSRFMGGSPHRILFFWHTLGNRILTFFANMFANLNLTDMETGYKIFRTDVIQQLYLQENRFGFEPEVTLKIARIKELRIYEVGISYYGRTYREGKKINWKDGVRTVWCIIKYGMLTSRYLKQEVLINVEKVSKS